MEHDYGKIVAAAKAGAEKALKRKWGYCRNSAASTAVAGTWPETKRWSN